MFEVPTADSLLSRNSVLVMAGGEENHAAFNEVYSFYHIYHLSANPIMIIGGGRVGGATSLHVSRSREHPVSSLKKGRAMCRMKRKAGSSAMRLISQFLRRRLWTNPSQRLSLPTMTRRTYT